MIKLDSNTAIVSTADDNYTVGVFFCGALDWVCESVLGLLKTVNKSDSSYIWSLILL